MLRLAAVPLVAIVATACTTPELPDLGDDDVEPDATPLPPDARLDCELAHSSGSSGYHNPGTACLDCHNGQQAGAPIFTFAGTVYADRAGTIPVVDASVIVIDGDGQIVSVKTTRNGNFYTQANLSPPYITAVSRCPDNVPMVTNFVDGDCNSCHSGAGSPGRVVFNP
jgi:hypothetical protein